MPGHQLYKRETPLLFDKKTNASKHMKNQIIKEGQRPITAVPTRPSTRPTARSPSRKPKKSSARHNAKH
jgi:hypothetical protein